MKACSLFLVAIFTLAVPACMNVPALRVEDTGWSNYQEFEQPLTVFRDVDLIFLIDTSLSMADEQVILQGNFPTLVRVLKDISGGLPNLHMGTISPDLGTYPYNLPGCEVAGGDKGRLMKGVNNACANPVGQTYVVDVEPRGCTIQKTIVAGEATTCDTHDCTQAHCDVAAFTGLDGVATEPAGLVLRIDDNQCPRCINYTAQVRGQDQSLEDVFSCMASLGTGGCGLEQHLEAVKQAVTDSSGNNAGFLRSSAYLAIFIISDEDDCSVKQAELFNPQGDINSTLGTLTSFRCTEFGVTCDQPWQRVMPQGQATYTNCAPRELNDPRNMLHPISVYTNTLSQLKDASMIIVGAITGPYGNSVTVGEDDNGNPRLLPSCGALHAGADPAVRLKAFVTSFVKHEEDLQWAFTSICSDDFSPALEGLGKKIKGLVEVQCLSAPVIGCPDPAFANGEAKLTQLSDTEAAICEPLCSVQDIDGDGHVTELPLCSPDYLGGHPQQFDPSLPVPKCYHVTYNTDCAVPCPPGSTALGCHPENSPWYGPSRGAEFIISRRQTATVGTHTQVACAGLPLTERSCHDGIDNDVDGRIDSADPDCQ